MKFEEEDTVAFALRKGQVGIGIVNDVYSASASESEDEDYDERLKPGQIGVEWYPHGKESPVYGDAVKLVDRTLMLGELVKFPRTNLIGFVNNVRVDCDFAVLPLNHFVIKNIKESRIHFVDQFGGFNSEAKYLVYDKWVGVVDSFTYLLTLRTFHGYKCRIKVDPDKVDVKDVLAKRSERSAFDDRQWYVGQILKFSTKTLSKAEWLTETENAKNLPEKMLKRFKSNTSKRRPNNIMFIVEKVEFDSVMATWFSSVSGSITPPNKRIDRHNIDRIQLLSYCDHQFVQIGDRIHLELQSDDVIVTEKQWKNEFYEEITSGLEPNSSRTQIVQNYRQLLSVTAPISSSRLAADNYNDDDSSWSDCLSDEHDSSQSTSDVKDYIKTDEECPCSKPSRDEFPANLKKVSVIGPGHTTTIFPQSYVKPVKSVHSRHRFSNNSCIDHLNNIKRTQKSAALLVRVVPGRSRRIKKRKLPNGKIIYRKNIKLSDKEFCRLQQVMSLLLQKRENLTPTDKIPAEALFVRSFVDVQWQDGTVGINIPTVNLAYAETDLDEHVFFPGSFVRLQQDKYKLWPAHGYGVVQWVDPQNRIAEVTWYDLLFDEQNRTPMGGSKLSKIKKEQVSVIELVADPDYSTYGSGSLVLRTNFYDDARFANPDDIYVGQVLYINTEGQVVVRWLNGRVENIFPFELCRLADDDAVDNEETSDEIDDSLDEEFIQDDNDQHDEDASSNDAWTDVDDDTDKLAHDDSDESDIDDDNLSSLSDCSEKVCSAAVGSNNTEDWVADVDDLVKRLTCMTQNFCDKMIEIRRSCSNSLSVTRGLAISALRVYRLLIRFRQYYAELFECVNQMHDLDNADLIKCAQVLQEWLKNSANLSAKKKIYLSETILANFMNEKEPKFKCKVKMGNYISKEINRLERMRDYLKDYIRNNLSDKNQATLAKSTKHHSSDGGLTEKFQILLKQTSYYVSKLGRFTLFSESDAAQVHRLSREIRNNPLVKELCSISSSFGDHFTDEKQTTSDCNVKSNAEIEVMNADESLTASISSTTDESEFFRRLVEAVLSNSNCLSFMEFMMACISTALEKKSLESESSLQAARLAKMDVSIVICLMIFHSIIINVAENRRAWISRRNLENEIENEETNKTNSNETANRNRNFKMNLCQDGDDITSVNANPTSPITFEKMPHFEYVDIEPTEHRLFVSLCQNDFSPKFWRAVRLDVKILQSSITENVYIKVYEKSYASEKLNPNLYQEGTVCVSLLGTWNGKDSEMWNPGSNLLQVIVSIQGLILNSEPYYNEAGYEVRRVNPDYAEKSRCYNEMALVRNLENLCNIIATRASPFMKEIDEHLLINVPKS